MEFLYHTGNIEPRKYDKDAGLDLAANERTVIPAGGWGMVPTGVRVQLPEGTFGWIVARSSTFREYGLIVLPGIIDEEYTGEYFASVYNTNRLREVVVEPGHRICQLVILPNLMQHLTPVKVDQIEDRTRGSNGFGSTGR